jgi:hypothetical protein
MSAWLLLQYLLIAFAVFASAVYVVQSQWPNAVRSARVACALPLLRDGRAPWLRALGRAVSPAPRVAEGSCGGCNNCGPEK